ncbi:MAG TPA: oligosaccharide flippase family protein [Patescibacteria group bacterium]
MKSYILKVVKHPFFAGSAVMILGTNLANFFASIYHIILARFLSLSLYADLAAVISVIAVFTAMFNFIGLVIVKFVSQAKDKDEVKGIFGWFLRRVLILGLIIIVVIVLATSSISNFLHIDEKTMVLVGPILFFALFSLVFKSFLQGLLKFGQFVFAINLEYLGRVVFGVVLIVVGLEVMGGVLGILLSSILSVFITWVLLSDYKNFKFKYSFKAGGDVFKYTVPVFLFSLASTSFLTTDIILVKHFINSNDAALYDALSTVGKIILYGSGPIGAVMFPMISKKHSKGENYIQIFLLSFALTSVLSLIALAVYLFTPSLPIGILYGQKYLVASGNLIWFGLFAAVFSLSTLVASFYLSIGKTKVVIFVVIFAFIQILAIVGIHDSILNIAKVNLAVTSFLLMSLLIYFGYEEARSKKA